MWALVGDGTYLMMPTEIVTAVQEGIAIKVLIVQNHGYASIGGLSESVAASGSAPTTATVRDGAYTGAPLPVDLAANAASLGMRVLRAKTVRDLRRALAEARAADTPTCVYVETQTADTVSGAPGRRPGGMYPWPRPRPDRRRSRRARIRPARLDPTPPSVKEYLA